MGNEQNKESAVSSLVHDCKAEERVNNAHVIIQYSGILIRPTAGAPPPPISPCMFIIEFTQNLRIESDAGWRRGGGSCPHLHPARGDANDAVRFRANK